MEIYFLSSNIYKIKEVKDILENDSLNIIPYMLPIKEIQSRDIEEIVIDKVIKAFEMLRRPALVEQTGLYIDELGGFPGGLTQIFWDSILADKFCYYFKNTNVTAKTILGYCNGKAIITFEGNISGKIVESPQGNRDFQWDCVFKPVNYDTTFAEMGDNKNKISMRKIALDKFKKYLEENDEK